jgi:N-acetylneuraminic acid mutarotase
MKYNTKTVRIYFRRSILLLSCILTATFVVTPSVIAAAPGDTHSWSTSANALPVEAGYATSVTYNGYAYEMGGYYNNGVSNAIRYAKLNSDGSVGAWSTSANALPQAIAAGSSVTHNGYVYVMGGRDATNGYTNTVYYAKFNSDGTVGTWNTSVNSLPLSMSSATAVTDNGYVYVLGGWGGGINGNYGLSTVYYAKLNSDGTVGTWNTSVNSLPQATLNSTAVTYNGYVYLMGGSDGNVSRSTVYYAKFNSDGTVGTWNTSVNSLPLIIAEATSVTYNGYVYYMGGYSNGVSSAVFYAKFNSDGTVGTWNTSVNSLPQGVIGANAVMYNGYAYVIGGFNGDIFSPAYYSTVFYTSLIQDPTASPSSSVTSGTTTGSNGNNLPTPPDTGYGTPASYDPVVIALIVSALISICVGVGIRYKSVLRVY